MVGIVLIEDPAPEVRGAILAPLVQYNAVQGRPVDALPIALTLQDEAGDIVGGLWGRAAYHWLFVELLAVPETMRGQGWGTTLMEQAEAFARKRGCVGMWLDTFSFQARPFYEGLGFTVFGKIHDNPVGSAHYFLSKRLDDPPA